jgi:AraC family transcriptional regulator of adaptative response/methylated-DNA-[protein]-cysteine methyltransferase
MLRWQETLTESFTGLNCPLRFVWSPRGLERVEHAALSPVCENATMVEGEVIRRFPALRLLVHGGRFTPDMVPLALSGTELQQRVWQEISAVPFGETITYSELAARVGRPDAVRSVASTCGANPVPLVIPCHRITAKDGGLGGFIWGVEVKHALLAREKAALHPLAA